jgi:hypothetical protein
VHPYAPVLETWTRCASSTRDESGADGVRLCALRGDSLRHTRLSATTEAGTRKVSVKASGRSPDLHSPGPRRSPVRGARGFHPSPAAAHQPCPARAGEGEEQPWLRRPSRNNPGFLVHPAGTTLASSSKREQPWPPRPSSRNNAGFLVPADLPPSIGGSHPYPTSTTVYASPPSSASAGRHDFA